MSDFKDYVSRDRVRARRVTTKTESVVTSNGVVTASQHDYIVERDVTEFDGTEYTATSILTNDEFNEKWKRWKDEDALSAKYDEGYGDGWRACQDANDTADDIVTREGPSEAPVIPEPVHGATTEIGGLMLPPVGDTLEENGPVKVRELPA